MWRNPSYLASDIVESTAVNNPYVAERMRVANLIVLPYGPDMHGSAADAMAGGDYDGDSAAFLFVERVRILPCGTDALYNTAYDGEYTCGVRDYLCKRRD